MNNDRGISVRAATTVDLPAIEALLIANHLPTVGVRGSLGAFLVAECSGAIIGVVGMERCGEYGLLRSTAVVQEWRGRGVARQLVERIVAAAEHQGIQALYLLTTTAETYFPTFGFAVADRDGVPASVQSTEEFRGACPASATVMYLPLLSPPAAR